MATYYKKINSRAAVEHMRERKKRLIIIAAIAVLAVVVIMLLAGAAQQRGFKASFLVTDDSIKIGLRTDVEKFAVMDETGNITGFDRDYIDEALRRLLPSQEKLIEYVPITSQDAGANIKYGGSNINLGLIVDGTEKVKGFRISDPYYMDNVVAVVQGTSRLDKISNIEGGKLGVFTAGLPDKSMDQYLSKNNLKFDVLRYSDYESAITDIEHNRVNAIIMPYAMARQFENAGFRVLAEPLFEVGYSIMLPTGQSAFCSELNKVIADMERDGTAAALRNKWGI